MENLKNEIQRAINLYKSHKFSEAELLSKKLIKLNPKIFFLYNLLGLILVGQGKNDEAIEYYEKGISIKPDYAMIYNNLGAVYKSKKNYVNVAGKLSLNKWNGKNQIEFIIFDISVN